jgi:GTP cyclohydrolase II
MNEIGAQIILPTRYGSFSLEALEDNGSTHLLLHASSIEPAKAVLVRVHSSCCFGEVFSGLSCDCRAQLELSLARIAREGGLLYYLQQEGRGCGLRAKIEAVRLEQSCQLDTVEAYTRLNLPLDARRYTMVSSNLQRLGIHNIRLLTNNPAKVTALRQLGIEVQREPLLVAPTREALAYLKTKELKMGHLLGSQQPSGFKLQRTP